MTTKYILTVTLNPVIDKTVHIPGFKDGDDFREEKLSVSAGGKGINVAKVLAYLKVPSCATGLLADVGQEYISDALRKQKIMNLFVGIKGSVRTSLTIIDPKTSRMTRIMERGPHASLRECERFKKLYRKALDGAACVILSGHPIPGSPVSFYAELIRIAHRKKVMSVFDGSGKPYIQGLKEKPFMIKPNIYEAEEALHMRLRSEAAIKRAAQVLYDKGIGCVAITRGSRGAYVYNGRSFLYARPPRLERKNPVGCGDSFIAGFVARHVAGYSYAECIRFAVACGSANAISFDPGDVDLKSIYAIYEKITIRPF
jgi:tagatose 6-phosphate kinase